jgi:ABC-2 type transport system ATP-binding protein
MIALIRSELYRTATIRSSWVSIVLFGALAASFGVLSAYWWALFAGIGAFGIAVFTVARHYQHRTAALLYLARPKRFPVLLAQVLSAVAVSWVFTAVTGITAVLKDGNGATYRHTLTVVPIMAVFGAAAAAVVRRSSWLLYGFAVWFVLVEGLIGQMKWPLPISSYLDAARGDPYGLEVFVVWAVGTLAVAALMLRRDFAAD